MNLRSGWMVGIGVLALACGANDGMPEEAVGQSEEPIVRGTTENGRNYVMELRIAYNSVTDGAQTVGYCSAVLFAPRVLLTAAHCIRPERNVGTPNYFVDSASSIIAYIGNNFQADFAALGPDPLAAVSAPPAPSRFMRADSWETHPSFTTVTNYADLAAVYLDRQPRLPPNTIVDPLPVGRTRLGSETVNQLLTIVGYGANIAFSADIQQNAGGLVKRRGTSRFVGAPIINPLPPDPHPGVLIPSVRNTLLELNGNSPNANGCAGDSGGPVIKNVNGQDFVFGIATWTGNFCENFSYYTRMDPFLPFVDLSYMKGGQAPTRSRLECITPKTGGGYRAYFGYNNENGVNVSVPYGTNNSFAQDTTNKRPNLFLPGNHKFEFALDFNNGQTLSWRLAPTNSPVTQLTVNSSSPKCNLNSRDVICAKACDADLAAGCGDTRPECNLQCNSFYEGISPCESAVDAYHQCLATQAPSDFECFDTFAYSQTCFDVFDAAYAECLANQGG